MIDGQFLSIRSQGLNRVKIGVKDIIVCLNIVAEIYYLGEINKRLQCIPADCIF